jgi:hypothetical protein
MLIPYLNFIYHILTKLLSMPNSATVFSMSGIFQGIIQCTFSLYNKKLHILSTIFFCLFWSSHYTLTLVIFMYYAPGVREIVKGKLFSPPRQSQSLGPEVTQSCPSIIIGTPLARFLICSATSKLKTAMSVKSFFYNFTRHWQKKLICQYSVNNTFVLVIMENRCKLCLLLSVIPFYFNCIILAGERSNICTSDVCIFQF